MIPCIVCGLAGFIQLDGGRLGCVIYRSGLERCFKLPHQDGAVACENGGSHCERERKRKCGFFIGTPRNRKRKKLRARQLGIMIIGSKSPAQ
jgi:hypothetical protein